MLGPGSESVPRRERAGWWWVSQTHFGEIRETHWKKDGSAGLETWGRGKRGRQVPGQKHQAWRAVGCGAGPRAGGVQGDPWASAGDRQPLLGWRPDGHGRDASGCGGAVLSVYLVPRGLQTLVSRFEVGQASRPLTSSPGREGCTVSVCQPSVSRQRTSHPLPNAAASFSDGQMTAVETSCPTCFCECQPPHSHRWGDRGSFQDGQK